MATLNQNNVYIQVRIKQTTAVGEFNSSLYFTPGEFEKLMDKDLQKNIQTVVANWVYKISNPPVPKGPTIEELQAGKEELQKQLSMVEDQINNLGN